MKNLLEVGVGEVQKPIQKNQVWQYHPANSICGLTLRKVCSHYAFFHSNRHQFWVKLGFVASFYI